MPARELIEATCTHGLTVHRDCASCGLNWKRREWLGELEEECTHGVSTRCKCPSCESDFVMRSWFRGLSKPNHDPVSRPKHYTSHPSGVECIQITEHMGFNLGNALKYIWRADEKGNAIEDLQKAAWYIDRELKRRGHASGKGAVK